MISHGEGNLKKKLPELRRSLERTLTLFSATKVLSLLLLLHHYWFNFCQLVPSLTPDWKVHGYNIKFIKKILQYISLPYTLTTQKYIVSRYSNKHNLTNIPPTVLNMINRTSRTLLSILFITWKQKCVINIKYNSHCKYFHIELIMLGYEHFVVQIRY